MKKLGQLNKMKSRAIQLVKVRISPAGPVHVFHHIPKCGGTSVKIVLACWFVLVPDYRSGWQGGIPDKVDVHRLRSGNCLSGHYADTGYYLHERYPEMLTSDRFRLITFVRDPLQVRLSLFRYENKFKDILHDRNVADKLEEHVFSKSNYLAGRFPATLENYKEVIDRYFFVGILEQAQASLDLLAHMIGKPPQKFPWENATRKINGPTSEELSDELIARFRDQNFLDYLIYDYCLQKFSENLARWNAMKSHESVSLASKVGVP
jgi:hypothetical protein